MVKFYVSVKDAVWFPPDWNLFQAKEELELAKKNYEALNTQLLEEIPGFTEKCIALVLDCLENFAIAQKKLYNEVHEDYDQLLEVLWFSRACKHRKWARRRFCSRIWQFFAAYSGCFSEVV